MGEAIVLLSGPCAGLKVVDTADILPPRSLSGLSSWSEAFHHIQLLDLPSC